MALYDLAILGDPTAAQRNTLTTTLSNEVAAFGLTLGRDIALHDASSPPFAPPHAAMAGVFFAGRANSGLNLARAMLSASIPVIPIIPPGGTFASLPDGLKGANGLMLTPSDPNMIELASALLECVGLLRKQRRAFISYRRSESSAVAAQLHDALAAKAFDVFLDTHDLRPGDPFQEILLHRLCDSDIMVMLDTPGYFASSWARQELFRARAKEIQVLQILWPGHMRDPQTTFSEMIALTAGDLVGAGGPLVATAAERITLAVESLRSRAIAARYLSVTGKFRAEISVIGARIEGIGAHRAISVRLPDGKGLWAYPVVGIPTADIFNDVANKAARAGQGQNPILVYDHVGMSTEWSAHLKWLDENIAVVRAIKAREAAYELGQFA